MVLPLDKAYEQALQGGGMPNAEPEPQDAPAPRVPQDKNPMSQQGDVFFIDPSLLGEGETCKVGEELWVKAKVQSKGSKLGLIPLEVTREGVDQEAEQEGF